MKSFFKMFKKAFLVTVCMLLLCSVIYPLALTGVSQLIFPVQANGSLIDKNGEPTKDASAAVGSSVIGQQFTDERFFRGRVSSVNYNTYTDEGLYAGTDDEYTGVASGSFNYAPSNPALKERVEADMAAFLETHPGVKAEDIPADLMTASGSGLDPHISIEAAKVQVPLISEKTGLSEEELNKIIEDATEGKALGLFGENKMNVLKANIAIADAIGYN